MLFSSVHVSVLSLVLILYSCLHTQQWQHTHIVLCSFFFCPLFPRGCRSALIKTGPSSCSSSSSCDFGVPPREELSWTRARRRMRNTRKCVRRNVAAPLCQTRPQTTGRCGHTAPHSQRCLTSKTRAWTQVSYKYNIIFRPVIHVPTLYVSKLS